MHVFVAGATGAVGRPLVSQLIGAGHVVTATTPYPGQPMSLRCWEGLCWSAEDDRRKDQAWDRQ